LFWSEEIYEMLAFFRIIGYDARLQSNPRSMSTPSQIEGRRRESARCRGMKTSRARLSGLAGWNFQAALGDLLAPSSGVLLMLTKSCAKAQISR
jgi:hypothetical protein